MMCMNVLNCDLWDLCDRHDYLEACIWGIQERRNLYHGHHKNHLKITVQDNSIIT